MLMCYFVSCAAFVCWHFPMMQCAFWPLLSQPHGGARFVKRANSAVVRQCGNRSTNWAAILWVLWCLADDLYTPLRWGKWATLFEIDTLLWKIYQKYSTEGVLVYNESAYWTLPHEMVTPSVVDLTNMFHFIVIFRWNFQFALVISEYFLHLSCVNILNRPM